MQCIGRPLLLYICNKNTALHALLGRIGRIGCDLLLPMFHVVLVMTRSCAKMAEQIGMPFGLWRRVGLLHGTE